MQELPPFDFTIQVGQLSPVSTEPVSERRYDFS